MHISNARLGFATNSSSSHSLILFSNRLTSLIKNVKDDFDDLSSFGWENFTLVSENAKKHYFAQQLFINLMKHVPENVAKIIAKEWADVDCEFGRIDHESVYNLPSDWSEKSLDEEFCLDFKQYLVQSNLVILGGNDNSEGHPLANGSEFNFNLGYNYISTNVCRKDGDWWTLFSRKNGTKLRVSFKDNPQPYVKATVPELVDIKVSDFCPFNCSFCYQSSTAKGAHADVSYLRNIAYGLGNKKVFEVALGGGETTMHPDFLVILKEFRKYNVVPNFTTKSLTWLKDGSWHEILKYAGAFAFSIERVEDVKKLNALVEVNDIDRKRASLQYVMGLHDMYTFKAILKIAINNNLRITLLGYKSVGRGKEHEHKCKDYSKWLDAIEEVLKGKSWYKIGIDTVLADQYEKELKKHNISEILYHTKEGKFSAYIDAVAKTTGPSSYEPDKMVKLSKCNYNSFDEKEWLAIYSKF